ncbi:protein RDM16-like [Lolium rigidum]|uniref:protein RDM16-like n=1 Tax=Lolium rigidum TaxID=89674 RepID=UPI001F5E04B5|nr:protein RDM16-like [Lolium rigidum]
MEIHTTALRLMLVLSSRLILHLLLRCHLLILLLQSTDGTPNSAAGRSSNLSLDALAKAKKALQLKKELSEKLKRLSGLNNKLGTALSDAQTPKKETQPVSGSSASSGHAGAASELPASIASGMAAAAAVAAGISGLTNIPNLDAVKRAQELAASMGFRQDPQFAPVINMFPGTSSELAVSQRPAKAPVLRLDAQGREIDEHGNVISMTKPSSLSTLKVNINKQKKDAFQIIKPDLESLAKSTVHFDERMGINPTKLLRPKRPGFIFVEEGKLTRQAELQRIKSQFGDAQAKELKVKQAQLAKAKVEVDMNPNLIEIAPGGRPPKQKQKEEIPDIEPWDSKILISATYEDDISLEKLNMDRITIYVEHPEPLEPPAEPAPPPPQPLKLTKKEQKKLRTQRRLAKEKDRQEMIRQGLLEPPKPKVKMSNLMKVLGAEATQDPTRMEMEIRTAAAEREQAHVDRNIARKLTPAERREKKERKLFDDPNTLDWIVCVYRIRDLSHPQTRFKVDVNAQENRLTGAAVIADGISVVVVEGGKKSIKRYNKLMLNRIDWAAAVGGEDDAEDEPDKPVNSCALVWQGSVGKRTFTKFSVHQCRSEAAAKKVFADASVPHYWDLAVNFSEDSS